MSVAKPRARTTGRPFASTLLMFLIVILLATPAISLTAFAQTQAVTATPGYINLGMTTSLTVTAPASGTYSVVVQKPSGAKFDANLTFTAGGQSQSIIFGNATIGFQTLVDEVGTYNVFVEQGSQVVGSTSFYSTNKLVTSFQMVVGGTCELIQGVTRGSKMFPHIFITYASNGAPWTNKVKGWSVNVTAPSGQVTPAYWDPYAKGFEIGVLPNWNYTYVGPWNPVIDARDAIGNNGSLKYTGSPFTIGPVELSTTVTVLNSTSGKAATTLLNGQSITIDATIVYPTNAEPVVGFVAPLSPVRGGSVTAQVGWGYYNTTSGSFGGKEAGALLGTVLMTYTGANGTWSGQFVSNNLPTLPAGTSYEVVVSSKDAASPSNVGFGAASLAPAVSAKTVVQTAATTTVVQTASPATVTLTSTQTAITTTITQTIPNTVYAALAVLLIVGIIIGLVVRRPK